MADVYAARAKRSLGGAWDSTSRRAILIFELEDGTRLELSFEEEQVSHFVLDFQKLPVFIEDEKRKRGMPVVQSTVTKRVVATEFGSDDIQQVAIIRTRFEDGTAQDTPIEKNALPELIRFLQVKQSEFDREPESRNITH